ncbi:protoheme IX farnesyltransferase, partial [Candidatus Saccharibacteria bacterium]
CVWWLWIGIKSYTRPDVIRWSKTMFGASLIVILIFSLMISIDSFLP